MTEAELAEFLHRCPTLYHMAELGSWPSIQRQGLLSTAALVDLFEVPATQRDAILGARRGAGFVLHHPVHGTVTVRDQKPMTDAVLRRCLDGMTPPEWYRLLNSRVFFWVDVERLTRLLNGREYGGRHHDVLEIDARALFCAYRDAIELSPMNSGAPHHANPRRRGRETFQPISSYDYAGRRQTRPPRTSIVEVTIADRVPDIARFVRQVVTMRGGDGG